MEVHIMPHKKNIRLVGAVALAVLTLGACGSHGSTTIREENPTVRDTVSVARTVVVNDPYNCSRLRGVC